jgi:hypothetical protein
VSSRRQNFRAGTLLFDPQIRRVYAVERLEDGRYLLRSLDALNPGTPKSASFIHLQIEDGYLQKITPRDYRNGTY